MSDIGALQAMLVRSAGGGCVELWNQARLDAYLTAGVVPEGLTVTASPCDGLADLLADPAVPVYLDPETDEAPWWDDHDAVVEKAGRFAGVLPVEVLGLDSDTSTVDTVGLADGGTAFVNRRDVPREVRVRALLVGQDCCAVRHGLDWLRGVLADAACQPGGVDLVYVSSCPAGARGAEGLCFDSTGECDPDVDPDCVELDCPDESEVYAALDVDEWWRTLTGAVPTDPVEVVGRHGADCGCGGAPVLEVTFGFTTGSPTPWLPARIVAAAVPFDATRRRPTFRFRKRPSSTELVTRTRVRREYQVVLQGNRWCPVGSWPATAIQQFGGEGYVTVREALPSKAQEWTSDEVCVGGSNCRAHHLRLILDETLNQLRFETVRWQNLGWAAADPLASVPCGCPVNIVELVRIHNVGDPPVVTVDTSAPGTGDDCCMVSLQWTSGTGGWWTPAAAAGVPGAVGQDAQWTDWNAFGSPPGKSGWPPAGCSMVVVRSCPPETPPVDICDASVECAVSLLPNGTWQAESGVPYDPKLHPAAQCRFTVAGQVTDPIVEQVYETVYGACASGCADVDPLDDPAVTRPVPPRPPLVTGSRCLPATTVEVMVGWDGQRVWASAVPIVEFYAGGRDVHGLEVLVWPNPLGVDPDDQAAARSAFVDCNACGAWSLSRVPAGSTLRIDGRTRKVTAQLPGGRLVLANRLLTPREGLAVRWPEVVSCGFVVAVRAGANQVDYAAARVAVHVAGSAS